MVPILAACRAAGHDILVACPESFTATVAGHGFTVAGFGDAPADEWDAVVRELPGLAPDQANRVVVAEVFGRIDTTAALPRLTATLERWRPDLILREPSEYASLLLSERAGVPRARVSIGLLSLDGMFAQAAADALDRLPDARGLSVDASLLTAGTVLAAAPATFDPPQDAGGTAVHRYAEPLAATPEPPVEAPEGDEPLVYVTFGTVAASLGVWPAIYRAVLDGLEGLAVRVLVTTGAGVEPAELGPVPAGVAVAAFVPQSAVLAFAAVAVVHGGFGTVLGSLRAGVPLVVAPLFADQSYNAARIEALGAGVAVQTSLDPGTVPPGLAAEVRAAVVRLLEDPAPRAASRALAGEMAAHPPVADLVPTLEALRA